MVDSATSVQFIAVDFDPFAGPAIARLAPTTEPQIEIWTACLLGGDDASRAYNESVSLRFSGPLNKPALEQAWQALVDRHEMLRSAFNADGTQFFVFQDVSADLVWVDCSHKTEADKALTITDYIKQDALHVFDLLRGPLVRAGLITLSDTAHHLTITAHHIVCDGWSLGILMQDLSALYSAYAQQIHPTLPDAPLFSEHAAHQRLFADSEEYRQTERFWIDQYRQPVPVLNLPTDFSRPAQRTYKSDRRDYELDQALVLAVKAMGVKVGCSFVTTLTAAFEVLLHQLTGQEDIVLGLPAAGQSATGNYRLVGHCVNLLPLRSFPKHDLSFVQFLKQRKEAVLDAFEHQQLTFGSLLKKITVRRDASRVSLVPVIFNVDMGLVDDVNFHGLNYRFISNPRQYEAVDLFLNAGGSEKALTLEWSYNTQLFRAETIDRMMAQFERLLRAVVANPATRLDQLQLVDQHEQTTPLADWNNTQAEYPRTVPLHELLTTTARHYPEKTAVIVNYERMSFRTLDETASRVAHYLQRDGVGVGDVVGVMLDRSPNLLVTLLAVLKAGAAYVPIDPDYPHDRIAFMLADSAARLLITSEKYAGRLAGRTKELSIGKALTESVSYPTTTPETSVGGTDLAYILYTSGSTGQPKGVMIEHRNLVNLLYSMIDWPGITSDDVLLGVTTVSFDIAGLELFLPLLTGATLVLADAKTVKDGRDLLQRLSDHRVPSESITLIQATPATYKMLLAAGWEKQLPLKILCCGEPMSNDLARQLIPRCHTLWNMYGPTETTIYSTGTQITNPDERITIGRPIHNTQVYIVDEQLNPLPVGVVGEIYIAGDGVARGYWNRPELTAERFVPNPFDAAAGVMYRTGDLGQFTDTGDIHCLGRVDQQVKIRGYRIELGEIENTLNVMDDIQEAVVVAREERPGDQRLVAYVVPKLSSNSDSQTDQLADWHQRWDLIYDMGVRYESEADQPADDLDTAIALQLSDQQDIRQQADEWLKQSIKRLRALKANRIMEVGCGAGQLLFALAPDAQQYMATDYAQTAIDALKAKLARQADPWPHVTAKTAVADDFLGVDAQSLDLVLVHSVAQYFPNMTYFVQVLERAVAATADGGCVFVGDVQGKATLKMHHTVDQFGRSTDAQPVGEFKKTVARRVELDDELLADPAFFYELSRLIPRISAVDTQLREGTYSNETTKHHYDVWLYVGKAPVVATADLSIDWRSGASVQAVEQKLTQYPYHVHQLTNVANARTARDYALVGLLDKTPDTTPIGTVKKQLDAIRPEAVDPTIFWTLGANSGFETHIRWSDDGADNHFDVVFIPANRTGTIPARPSALRQLSRPLDTYVKSPFQPAEAISFDHIRRWKQQAAQVLPDYMVPSDFVVLSALPLTPNGKIDRKALPKPTSATPAAHERSAKPENEEEELLLSVWTDILGRKSISVHDDFFELGGHSLIAVQMMVRLEKEMGRKLPLAALFEHSTIAKLARLLKTEQEAISWNSLVPIKPHGNKPPLYIVHGAGLHVMLFNALATNLDPEQPVYGLQAKGLDGGDEPLPSIEAIAAHYIAEVIAQNPNGPYLLAGYSLGGLIAYEMARQLIAAGKQVKLLAMFDTYAPQSSSDDPLYNGTFSSPRMLINKVLHTIELLRRDPGRTIVYKTESIERKLIEHYWRVKDSRKLPYLLTRGFIRLYWRLKFQDEQRHDVFTSLVYKIEMVSLQALRNYQPPPVEVAVELFRAKDQVFFMDDFDLLGWKPFALRGVRVHDIPGDHNSIFSAPNDQEFGRVLQRVLDANNS